MKGLLGKEERDDLIRTYRQLLHSIGDTILPGDIQKVRKHLENSVLKHGHLTDVFGLNLLSRSIHTALIIANEMGLRREPILVSLLEPLLTNGDCTLKEIEADFGKETAGMLQGLAKVSSLYDKSGAIDNENFRTLLISFAEDLRVILILIAQRLYLMRIAKSLRPDQTMQIAAEASYLYAPLSHRLGLYKIKSELEDLSLKIQDREMYAEIAHKLNATKRARDQYIAEFIAPVEAKLTELGLNFDIKGRTKSIHSIRNKLLKQKVEFEAIYDLFAIRVILDTPVEKEKAECWQVYSVITDMYQPNPKRLKDWLSVPKSNGYESLHTTVMGPGGKWVEVQIRSRRMDEIAEKGLAAHWKYKGVKDDESLDRWLTGVREVLEHKEDSPTELIHDFKMNLYEEEIIVFTPKGDLFKLPHGATVLDFAFAIHTLVGSRCVSGKINGKNVPIKHKLQSGDQVEILTSPNQSPKQDWLSFAVTSRARVKIKQSLKEQSSKQVEFAKELLHRRFKNRKIEEDESLIMRMIRKKGYKTVTDFYVDVANERLDINSFIDFYLEQEKREQEVSEHVNQSVENYVAQTPQDDLTKKEDVLVIDQDLTGIDYSLAKCCNPIYGDEIFGFVSSKGIKIHRLNCPNAPAMFNRYGYRIVKSRWAGKSGASYPVTLRIVGNDDIGIVTNITSVISKEKGTMLRSINVDPADGLFQGTITVMLSDTSAADGLIKKIKTVKGVKQVSRS